MNKRAPIRECVALTCIKSLGARRIQQLLDQVDHPQDVFRLSKKQLQEIDGIGPSTAGAITGFDDWQAVDRILERTEKIGSRIITQHDPDYPPLLREIYDPPLILWLLGNSQILTNNGIAVVGTRRPSRYGLETARFFARQISRRGLPIISGLAHGIDTVAHKAALAEKGGTVAVLGSGIDVIYPAANRGLARSIIHNGGAIISEFPLGTSPESGNFPVRNRIVSGMTLGSLVAESGREGGSMITAYSALDQNREVFAVPHRLDNESGKGGNAIIKRGHGKLVQRPKDILDEISVQCIEEVKNAKTTYDSKKNRWKEMNLDRTAQRICSLLETKSMHIDLLAEQLSMKPNEVMGELLELEMQDCVRARPGKVFELC